LLDTESQLNKGRIKDSDTIAWWERQSEEAKAEAYSVPEDERTDTLEVLEALNEFIQRGGKDVLIWGNGSDFDNCLLADIFRNYVFTIPLKFYNNRCFRTFKSEFKHLAKEPTFEGIKHHALYDAKHQVSWL